MNGPNGLYTAAQGYDLVTGWGSPAADHLVPDLVLWQRGGGAAAAPPGKGNSSIGSLFQPLSLSAIQGAQPGRPSVSDEGVNRPTASVASNGHTQGVMGATTMTATDMMLESHARAAVDIRHYGRPPRREADNLFSTLKMQAPSAEREEALQHMGG